MICSKCGYPNPNGYVGACKSCRAMPEQEPIQVAKTVAKKTQVKKASKKSTETLNGKDQ
jgi:predicted ATP-dependent serine protease